MQTYLEYYFVVLGTSGGHECDLEAVAAAVLATRVDACGPSQSVQQRCGVGYKHKRHHPPAPDGCLITHKVTVFLVSSVPACVTQHRCHIGPAVCLDFVSCCSCLQAYADSHPRSCSLGRISIARMHFMTWLMSKLQISPWEPGQ